MRRLLAMLALAGWLVIGAMGCLTPGADRCDLPPERYRQARLLYDAVGSMRMVRELLLETGWRRCEINEAQYRLRQEIAMSEPGQPLVRE